MKTTVYQVMRIPVRVSKKHTHWKNLFGSRENQDKKEFLLFFIMPLCFSGLQTKCFFCSANTVGCLGFHDPPNCDGGLPLNLLLLCPTGVASTAGVGGGEDTLEVRHILCGSQTNDCRPMARSFLSLAEEF